MLSRQEALKWCVNNLNMWPEIGHPMITPCEGWSWVKGSEGMFLKPANDWVNVITKECWAWVARTPTPVPQNGAEILAVKHLEAMGYEFHGGEWLTGPEVSIKKIFIRIKSKLEDSEYCAKPHELSIWNSLARDIYENILT